jgi:hypothetical protein
MTERVVEKLTWPPPWSAPDHHGVQRVLLHRGIALHRYTGVSYDALERDTRYGAFVFDQNLNMWKPRVNFTTLLELRCWLIARGYLPTE